MVGHRPQLPKPRLPDEHAEWFDDALCQQIGANFFPQQGDRQAAREAKDVCHMCSVQTQCLSYALEHDERFGVWGGMSERERRQLDRQRRDSA